MACLKHHTRALPGVQVYPLALGEKPGNATLHINTHSRSSSLLPLGAAHRAFFPGARESNAITVEVSTLDAVFSRIELASPVLLKLDVHKPLYEGEKIFMEIAQQIQGYCFSFLRPVGWLTAPETGEILQMDALFQRNVSNGS